MSVGCVMACLAQIVGVAANTTLGAPEGPASLNVPDGMRRCAYDAVLVLLLFPRCESCTFPSLCHERVCVACTEEAVIVF